MWVKEHDPDTATKSGKLVDTYVLAQKGPGTRWTAVPGEG